MCSNDMINMSFGMNTMPPISTSVHLSRIIISLLASTKLFYFVAKTEKISMLMSFPRQ